MLQSRRTCAHDLCSWPLTKDGGIISVSRCITLPPLIAQADRRKQEAAERSVREAQEAAEQAEAERRAAETEAERAAAELRSTLALKEAALPAEPAATEPDSMTVMVRMPNGSRFSRR